MKKYYDWEAEEISRMAHDLGAADGEGGYDPTKWADVPHKPDPVDWEVDDPWDNCGFE